MNKKVNIALSLLLALIMIFSVLSMPAAFALEALETSDEDFIVRDFVVEDNKETAAEDDGLIYDFTDSTRKELKVKYCVTDAETVTIPAEKYGLPVVLIAADAFDGTTGLQNLKTVNIAPTVQKIESKAFNSCALLSAVNFLPFEGETGDAAVPDITEISADAFYNCASIKAIIIPKGVILIGAHAFGFTYSDSAYQQINGFTITGHLNTAAYKYANENSFAFSPFGSTPVIPVQSFSLNKAQDILNVGEFAQLIPVFGANDPTNTFVRWFSNDKSVAVVDKNGKVTGVSGGEVTITAISSDNLKTATCAITVNGPSSGSKVTAVEFTGNLAAPTVTAYYSTGSTTKYRITYVTTPADAPYDAVAFDYDNTYLNVEYDTTAMCYYLIPKKLTSGTDTVLLKIYSVAYPSTVFNTVNIKISDEIKGVQWYSFTANDGIPFIVTNLNAITWKANEGRLDFAVKLLPSNATATMDDIIISSSNENVAYWNNNNELVPLRDGVTILTVTTKNGGYTDTIKVTLSGTGSIAVLGLKFTLGETQEVTYSKSYDLSKYLEFNPKSPTNKKVTWKSSDESIISVTDKGVITCKKVGIAVITATSEENDEAVATVIITVTLAWWQKIIFFILRLFGFSN